jgi:hypothetical protein
VYHVDVEGLNVAASVGERTVRTASAEVSHILPLVDNPLENLHLCYIPDSAKCGGSVRQARKTDITRGHAYSLTLTRNLARMYLSWGSTLTVVYRV